MSWRAIAPEQWSDFLQRFSARHEGSLVNLSGTIATPSDYVPLRELRFVEDSEDSTLLVSVGDVATPTLLRFRSPRTMRVELSEKAIERALLVEGLRGELTLRFRNAIPPELIDGPAP